MDEALTQGCSIEWADDDSKTPYKRSNLQLLFQSPTPQSHRSLNSLETAATSDTTKSLDTRKSDVSPLATQPKIKSERTKERRVQEEVDFIFSVLGHEGSKDVPCSMRKSSCSSELSHPNYDPERTGLTSYNEETGMIPSRDDEKVLLTKEFHAMLSSRDEESVRAVTDTVGGSERWKKRKNSIDQTSKRLFEPWVSPRKQKKLCHEEELHQNRQKEGISCGKSSFDSLLMELRETSSVHTRDCKILNHEQSHDSSFAMGLRKHPITDYSGRNHDTSCNKHSALSQVNKLSVPDSTTNHSRSIAMSIKDEFDDINFDEDVFAAVDAAIEQRQTQTQMNGVSAREDANPNQAYNPSQQSSHMSPCAKKSFQRSPTLITSNRTSDVLKKSQEQMPMTKCQTMQHSSSHAISTFNQPVHVKPCSVIESDNLVVPPRSEPTLNVIEDDFMDFSSVDFEKIDELVAKRDVSKNIHGITNGQPDFITCTRYRICSIENHVESYRKVLGVVSWKDSTGLEQNNVMKKVDVDDNKRVDGFVHLLGEWYHTLCEVGDVIHLCSLGGKYNTEPCALPIELNTTTTEDDIVLILHPDQLITPTTISETVSCLRRAILKTKYGSSGLTNKSALIGQMRHDLFEKCLLQNNYTKTFAQHEASVIVRAHGDQLIGAGLLNENEITLEVLRILPNIRRFAITYTNFVDGHGRGTLAAIGHSPTIDMCAERVQCTEEFIVSTELGIKGFIDATVEVKSFTQSSSTSGAKSELSNDSHLMGIELKTGHNQTPQHAHMAQLALYAMALRSRYGSRRSNMDLMESSAGNGGMLLYLNSENLNAVHVSPSAHELKSLLGQRNFVAAELRQATAPRGVILEYDESKEDAMESRRVKILPATPAVLPDLLHSSHSCERCYSNRECFLNAAVENTHSRQIYGSTKTHAKLLKHFTGHLNTIDLEYFKEWDRLIDLEASSSSKEITKAWLKPSLELESSTGKTISSLTIEQDTLLDVHSSATGVTDFYFTCKRALLSLSANPLNVLKFEVGSRAVLSTDGVSLASLSTGNSFVKKHVFGLARVCVKGIFEDSVHVQVNRADYMRIARLVHKSSSDGPPLLFRLDKDDIATGFSTLRQNLLNLFTTDILPFSTKTDASQETLTNTQQRLRSRAPSLRRSIVHLDEPQFEPISLTHILKLPDMVELSKEFWDLNEDQRAAAQKVISAKSYSLIQGFPGTGKTSTITFIVRLLVAMGKRILVTSYTHAAVDNILMKLVERLECHSPDVGLTSAEVIRVGPKTSVHPSLHSHLAHEVALESDRQEMLQKQVCHPEILIEHTKPSLANLYKVITKAKVVGVSALTIPKTPLLIGQEFDFVIVDEAGQISQPAIIGALLAADKFVLVGDHEQLPPLVQNDVADEAGYSESMLKRLADKHPVSVAQLTLQYRMHEDICLLPNLLVYKGALKCANDIVRKTKLTLPGFPSQLKRIIKPGYDGVGWLLPILNPNKNVVFVNTDSMGQNLESSYKAVARESNNVGGLINDVEIEIAKYIVLGLFTCGLNASSIGIISPYRAQVNRLEEDTFISTMSSKNGLDVSTIDRYQGRDKETVIVSLARSNEAGKTGRLLEDKRRLNVALSRAKKKLIILGSYNTLLKGCSVLKPVLNELKSRHWIESPPSNATDYYNITVD